MRRRWLKGVTKVRGRDAGVMDHQGGTRKVVIHTEGVDRGHNGKGGNALWLAQYVAAANSGYHFTIDRSGRVAQLYSARVGSRAMKAGRWSPNRQGDIAIQVCFAGINDARQLEDWPLLGWDRLMRFFDSWDVPRTTPVGWGRPERSSQVWRTKSGFFSHAHAPFNDHTDGSHAPIHRLLK